MKKTQIGRFAPHVEKVDQKAAMELWEYIAVAINAIYDKVIVIIIFNAWWLE